YEEYVDKYMDALITGDGPDIMIIDSNEFGRFNSLQAFADLEALGAAQYKDETDPDLWRLGNTFDQKKLIGLPFASAPLVTYYRADIMEENGFPSDPVELGNFMADPKNWMRMAEKLKENDHYVIQWAGDPIRLVSHSQPYFDENLNWVMTNDKFRDMIDITRTARDKNLVAYTDIWSEDGKDKLQNGGFAMLYLGSWGARELETNMAPDQKGKWRVTRLPFDLYAMNNATIMSVPANAQNQELAWDFIEYYTYIAPHDQLLGSVASYLPGRNHPDAIAHVNEYLGGQKDQVMYESITEKTKEAAITPLDKDAYAIWDRQINIGLEEKYTTDQIIENINKTIEKELSTKREHLKNQ
ncbi:MAG: ABC transporter substrate-binding protein, partial [Bacilli bacterium]